MFAVSFRIAFRAFGQTSYVNGSCLSARQFNKGDIILVSSPDVSSTFAEVIDSRETKRADFNWNLVK